MHICKALSMPVHSDGERNIKAMKDYQMPVLDVLPIPLADILTVSLSGLDDGEPMPDGWIVQD